MPEIITLNALDLSGESLTLFLRKSDGSLLNTGGDAMTEAGSTGVFTATLAEDRSGLGPLHANVCVGSEASDNLLWDGPLNQGTTILGNPGYAELNAAGQDAIAAKVATVLAGSHGAGSWEGGGGAGGGGLTEEQDTILTEIHEAIYPEDPDVSPIVITPAAIGETTGYFTCRDAANAAKSGVVVSVILDKLRSGSAGTAFFATAREFTSAENGLVQITHLVPGCAYNLTISGSLHWVRVPPSAGTTFALPDIKN